MPPQTYARPQITVLQPDQIEQVHAHSLEVLSTVGVQVESPRARDIYAREIPATMIDGERVQIPPELVSWALQVAPAGIAIYNRQGTLLFHLGEGQDRPRFGIGVTALYYQDPLTDRLTPFHRHHMERCVRLGNALALFDVVSTIGVVQDVPANVSDLYATLDMVANTVKPLVILVSEESRFPAVLDLVEHLHGDLGTNPFIIPYLNPITPLIINQGTSDKMISAIDRGLPLIYSNYSMAGASSPITPAGTLVLLNAELLAGLTLSQMIKPGTPIILGMLPALFDMKTMVNFYDPQSMLLNLACTEMMAHYNLPHCGTSGSGTGWGPDLLAAETYWMNHLTTCMGKVGLAPFVGDTLTSKAFAPATVVYAHEVIEQALQFARGFTLDPAAVALEEIAEVGPGGSFFLTPSTLAQFRQAYFQSAIFPRWSMEEWQAAGSPQAGELLRRHTAELLQDLAPPDDHADIITRGTHFIEAKLAQGRL